MVEGDSMRTSVFLQACQEETRRPSNQPRNLELASRRKETVNTPCSTQMRMSSAGSPSTGANWMPWPSIHSRYSAWEAILTVWPSFCRPWMLGRLEGVGDTLHRAMYGWTSPLDPIVKQVNRRLSAGLNETMDTALESNITAGVSSSDRSPRVDRSPCNPAYRSSLRVCVVLNHIWSGTTPKISSEGNSPSLWMDSFSAASIPSFRSWRHASRAAT